jgi:hypothetical protein
MGVARLGGKKGVVETPLKKEKIEKHRQDKRVNII